MSIGLERLSLNQATVKYLSLAEAVSYQVCDWVLPLPQDILLGRGHLGDGVIDFGPISAGVAAAGYDGYVEVEIFNAEVWEAPPDQTATTVRERFGLASR